MVVELGQAGGHLPRAGAGGGDHHQRPGGLNIIVALKALVGHNPSHIVGIAGNGVVEIHLHAQVLQPPLEGVRRGLGGVPGDDHAAHMQPLPPEGVDEPQHILVVGDAQVSPDLVLFNVGGVDGHHDLRAVPQLQQHPDFAVRSEAGQHPGGVVVVEQLAAEFQIQLAAELSDALPDAGGLGLHIAPVVKSDLRHMILGPCPIRYGPVPPLASLLRSLPRF